MYGQLEKIVDMIRGAPEAEPFLAPVSRELAPDYDEVRIASHHFAFISKMLAGD